MSWSGLDGVLRGFVSCQLINLPLKAAGWLGSVDNLKGDFATIEDQCISAVHTDRVCGKKIKLIFFSILAVISRSHHGKENNHHFSKDSKDNSEITFPLVEESSKSCTLASETCPGCWVSLVQFIGPL